MALPSIVKIAEENGIVFDPKNKSHKRELLALCPFCNNHRKYYLSINQDDNVFKCWYCKASGGVLQFEADLTGKSFQEVKEKYFGKYRRRRLRQAELLSPRQLDVIGWQSTKRQDRNLFKRSLKQIEEDWKKHLHQQKRLAFAKLLLAESGSDYKTVINSIKDQAERAKIPSLLDDVLAEYSENVWEKPWALEGQSMAIHALETSLRANDHNELYYLLFIHYGYMRVENQTNESEQKLAMTI